MVSGQTGAGRTILVIDDDAEIREALSDSLSPICSAVHSAESAEAALAVLATVGHDVRNNFV